MKNENDVGNSAESLVVNKYSALSLATDAWEKKQKGITKTNLPLEFAAIVHGASAEMIADQLEYIAHRMRETGWSAGSGGGRGMSTVWEMFQKHNAEAGRAEVRGSAKGIVAALRSEADFDDDDYRKQIMIDAADYIDILSRCNTQEQERSEERAQSPGSAG